MSSVGMCFDHATTTTATTAVTASPELPPIVESFQLCFDVFLHVLTVKRPTLFAVTLKKPSIGQVRKSNCFYA